MEYQALGDDEILRLAADRENLLDEARQALEMELGRRGLTTADMEQYQAHIEKVEMIQQVGDLPLLFPYGIGKRLFGKKALVIDQYSTWEEFDTTLWIVIFWVPLIPVTTYRVRRQVRRMAHLNPWQSYKFIAVSRRGLDWALVLTTWAWAVFTILLLVGALWLIDKLRFYAP